MSIIYTNSAKYALNVPISGANHVFPKIWTGGSNAISFQIQWNSALVAGSFTVFGSNQDLPNNGSAGGVTYPVPLTPIQLATINVATPPYSTALAAGFDLVTAFHLVWVEYVGAGTGIVSIATNVKSYG